MAKQTILSKNQERLLEIISQNNDICKLFYLTGGTALAEFYLKHRLSEDLDFFSETEVNPQAIFVFLTSIKKKIDIRTIQTSHSQNRYF